MLIDCAICIFMFQPSLDHLLYSSNTGGQFYHNSSTEDWGKGGRCLVIVHKVQYVAIFFCKVNIVKGDYLTCWVMLCSRTHSICN
jgi:hypothetical protein